MKVWGWVRGGRFEAEQLTFSFAPEVSGIRRYEMRSRGITGVSACAGPVDERHGHEDTSDGAGGNPADVPETERDRRS